MVSGMARTWTIFESGWTWNNLLVSCQMDAAYPGIETGYRLQSRRWRSPEHFYEYIKMILFCFVLLLPSNALSLIYVPTTVYLVVSTLGHTHTQTQHAHAHTAKHTRCRPNQNIPLLSSPRQDQINLIGMFLRNLNRNVLSNTDTDIYRPRRHTHTAQTHTHLCEDADQMKTREVNTLRGDEDVKRGDPGLWIRSCLGLTELVCSVSTTVWDGAGSDHFYSHNQTHPRTIEGVFVVACLAWLCFRFVEFFFFFFG